MNIDKWIIEEAINTLHQANIALLGITGLDSEREIKEKIKNKTAINRRIDKAITLLNNSLKEVMNPNLKLDSIRTVREYCTEHSRIWIEIYKDNPKACVFTHLLVDENHRRKGYGTKALKQAEIIAKDLGCNTIYLKVANYSWISEWYLRLGYKFLTNVEDNYIWLIKNI